MARQDSSASGAASPDQWVQRDSRLIPLTGPHPFNAEPPLSELIKSHITPNELHYVRNHGSVPRLSWTDHRLSIDGLINSPRQYTMDELCQDPLLDELRVCVTMTCDGNRRKELNYISHGRGFNWGAGATSTAYWTGVTLSSLLIAAGIKTPSMVIPANDGKVDNIPRYVCFEGADELSKGRYGTSIPLCWALEDAREYIVAYRMNDQPLPPDHGYPIRLILPGMVGGRQVKWLQRITVSAYESSSPYHYEDNRVLPSHVDWDMADSRGWWYKPEYVLYDLNINSVICDPQHEQFVSVLHKPGTETDQSERKQQRKDDQPQADTYTVKGYAYTGGGRRIIRVELSLNEGKTWQSVDKIRYPDWYTDRKERGGRKQWDMQQWLVAQARQQEHEEKEEEPKKKAGEMIEGKEGRRDKEKQDHGPEQYSGEEVRQKEKEAEKGKGGKQDTKKQHHSADHGNLDQQRNSGGETQSGGHDDRHQGKGERNQQHNQNILVCSNGPGSTALTRQDRDWRTFGRPFCWCHWELAIPVWKFIQCKFIIVRAFDESGNTQPHERIWNVLGMFNNSWYKLQVDVEASGSSPTSFPLIAFRHPVQPGALPGGWLKPDRVDSKHQRRALTSLPHALTTEYSRNKLITLEEVKRHSSMDDLWIIIDEYVYDVTSYLRDHPPGPIPMLMMSGGKDASQLFHEIHASDAFEIKDRFIIGKLQLLQQAEAVEQHTMQEPASSTTAAGRTMSPSLTLTPSRTSTAAFCSELTHPAAISPREKGYVPVLNPRRWLTFTLTAKKLVSPDTYLFTLSYPGQDSDAKLYLPTGNHILVGFNIAVDGDEQWIVRPYTPTAPCYAQQDDGVRLELLIKIYRKNQNPLYPEGGLLTQHLEGVEVGSPVQVKGPAGHIRYRGRGRFTLHGVTIQASKVSLLCGGTGITPMWQLLSAILADSEDTTELAMIYTNKSIKDVLLRDELDSLVRRYGDDSSHAADVNSFHHAATITSNEVDVNTGNAGKSRFHLWYSVSKVGEGEEWRYGVGHVNEYMMRRHIYMPDTSNIVLLCGPPSFVSHGCMPALYRLGYDDERIFEF